MRVYIVWVKGKKVTLKNLQVECFASISQVDPSRETLVKLIACHDTSTYNMYFSHAYFTSKHLKRH